MDDFISREKAINKVSGWLKMAKCPYNQSAYNCGEISAYETCLEELKFLPAADGAGSADEGGRAVRRWQYLKTLTLSALVEYMERELGDSVPVDWAEWLSELIEEE